MLYIQCKDVCWCGESKGCEGVRDGDQDRKSKEKEGGERREVIQSEVVNRKVRMERERKLCDWLCKKVGERKKKRKRNCQTL